MPRIRNKEKFFTLATVVCALIISSVGVFWYLKKQSRSSESASSGASSTQNKNAIDPKIVRLIAVGDMVPHDSVNLNAKQADGSYKYLSMMSNMKPFFDKSDVRFCNQATPAGGTGFGVSGYPTFNAPTEFSRDMAALGCNVINFASNHSFDKGQSVIDATLDYWDTVPNILAIAGANRTTTEQNTVRYFETKGVKFAFLAYTTYTNSAPPNSFGVNVYSETLAGRQLAEAKSKADVIIVSMRWGTEYSGDINSSQDEVAQFLADNGATVILGHGSHVLQPVKLVKAVSGQEVPVWFSLGNFLNSQVPPETLFNGIAVMDINMQEKNINISYLPVYMHYEWTADEARAGDLLKRRNLTMYTLDNAAEPLGRSQNKTTVEAQRERITNTLNKFTKVQILHDSEY